MFLFCRSLAITLFVGYLDQTVVTTALPQIASDFHAGNNIAWVGTSYLMTSTAAQVRTCWLCIFLLLTQLLKPISATV